MVRKTVWIFLSSIVLCTSFVCLKEIHAASTLPLQTNQGHKNVEGSVTQVTADTISLDVGGGVNKTFTINKREKNGIKRFKIGDRVLIDLDDDLLVIDISVLSSK